MLNFNQEFEKLFEQYERERPFLEPSQPFFKDICYEFFKQGWEVKKQDSINRNSSIVCYDPKEVPEKLINKLFSARPGEIIQLTREEQEKVKFINYLKPWEPIEQ